jgi:DNA polymerase V
MIKHARQGLERIYKPGYRYNKAGVMLTEIVPQNRIQQNLLDPEDRESMPLMETIDKINKAWGRDTIRFAVEGLQKSWQMKQSHKSPSYTTSWAEIPEVKASL